MASSEGESASNGPKWTKFDEQRVEDELKAHARQACDMVIRTFVECSKDRTFSVVWACRDQLNRMNTCLKQYTTEENREAIRERLYREKAAAQS